MAGKPAKMGRASGYIMWAFAKAPRISSPSATTTRSSLLETRNLQSWSNHCSGSRPLSARPTRRFSAAPAAAGPRIPSRYTATLLSEVSNKRADFSQRVWQESCGRAACLGHAHTEPVRSPRQNARQSMSFALPAHSQWLPLLRHLRSPISPLSAKLGEWNTGATELSNWVLMIWATEF